MSSIETVTEKARAVDNSEKTTISGPVVSVPGRDIDTDRIIPARFMKHLTFEHLGRHVFEDDRAALRKKGLVHPFDDVRNTGARILLVDGNFGCGSSREHAPQAIHRWGIQAVVGESFGEIFAGNCVSVGMPCVQAAPETMAALRQLADEYPDRAFTLDLEARALSTGNHRFGIDIAEGPRKQFMDGSWDPMAMLLAACSEIDATARRLPSFPANV